VICVRPDPRSPSPLQARVRFPFCSLTSHFASSSQPPLTRLLSSPPFKTASGTSRLSPHLALSFLSFSLPPRGITKLTLPLFLPHSTAPTLFPQPSFSFPSPLSPLSPYQPIRQSPTCDSSRLSPVSSPSHPSPPRPIASRRTSTGTSSDDLKGVRPALQDRSP
jgi:hypothetical protein